MQRARCSESTQGQYQLVYSENEEHDNDKAYIAREVAITSR